MVDTYQVKTDVFEGPLDLLLTLIEKRKLLINDISLAKVTDDFISHLEDEGRVPLSARAHFVLVASTLLLVKSKSLLPALELSSEESESIDDLERRLKLYKRYRELGLVLEKQFGKNALYGPSEHREVEPLFVPTKKISPAGIKGAIASILQSLPKKEFVPKAVVEKVISLEEMIEDLAERITKGISLSFQEFSGMGKEEKTNVIVGFLAMLELVKQGSVSVTQNDRFSDITIESDAVSTPRYG